MAAEAQRGRDLLKFTQLGILRMIIIMMTLKLITQTTCSVPGPILSALHILTHLILNNPRRQIAITILILILQMRKVRQRVK